MPVDDRAQPYLDRLERVRADLDVLASTPIDPARRTSPDASTGETWTAANVWSHLNEFPVFWLAELEKVIFEYRDQPVPFGRTTKDPDRIASIHARLDEQPAALLAEIGEPLDRLAELLDHIEPFEWEALGVHETLGVMTVPQQLDEFLVGHLEEHRDQLRSLL